MADKLPEGYFCPKCNMKATRDMVAVMKRDDMPTLYIVNMAMHILSDASCPTELLKPIAKWMGTYGENINGLTEEEQDKLKLVKWKSWATQ